MKVLHYFLLLVCLVLSVSIYAQNYKEYLDIAKREIVEGNYENAQKAYDVYKKLTNQTDSEIENLLKRKTARSGQNFIETAYGINMKMVYVKGGTFRMGATEE